MSSPINPLQERVLAGLREKVRAKVREAPFEFIEDLSLASDVLVFHLVFCVLAVRWLCDGWTCPLPSSMFEGRALRNGVREGFARFESSFNAARPASAWHSAAP